MNEEMKRIIDLLNGAGYKVCKITDPGSMNWMYSGAEQKSAGYEIFISRIPAETKADGPAGQA
jgi:hypothetical protein